MNPEYEIEYKVACSSGLGNQTGITSLLDAQSRKEEMDDEECGGIHTIYEIVTRKIT